MPSILVHVAKFTAFGPAASYAADLAVAMNAALTGLYLAPVVVPLLVMDAPVFMNDITEDLIAHRDNACAAEPAFLTWANSQGVQRAAWQVVEGGLDAALAIAGDWYDFSIVGMDGAGAGHWQQPAAVGDLLVTAGHPILVVPAGCSTNADLRRVAIAWNGSREAMRAVHAALPLLRRANQVVLLKSTDEPSLEVRTWHPPLSIERYFETQELQVVIKPVHAAAEEAGSVLLQEAAGVNADLLVMGAYGHRRLSEWILGGATRHVLEHARLPVFMRH